MKLRVDQSGYVKQGTKPVVALLTDYCTKEALVFLSSVIGAYAVEPAAYTSCGYACTDSYAWGRRGYPTAALFESLNKNAFPYNDRVSRDGSPLDTLDVIDWGHLEEFVKATVGFVAELSVA